MAGTGVTSAFARTAPVTAGGDVAETLPCQTGLEAVGPSLAVATNTMPAGAPEVLTICPRANGTHPVPGGAHVSVAHVSPGGSVCELMSMAPPPSGFNVTCMKPRSVEPAGATTNSRQATANTSVRRMPKMVAQPAHAPEPFTTRHAGGASIGASGRLAPAPETRYDDCRLSRGSLQTPTNR